MPSLGKRSRTFLLRYRRNRLAIAGATVLFVLVLIAVAAPYIAARAPLQTAVGPSLSPPSDRFLLGTDDIGRDTFSGVVYGTRITLVIGVLAASTATFIGTFVGLISGYFGGFVDDSLMRMTETVTVIPRFIFALVLVTLFGTSIWNVIFVVGALSWPQIAKIVRAEVLSLKEREFVEAAKSMGAGHLNIMFSEILPNTFHVIIVTASLGISEAILIEAGLSFVGLSDPNILSWGRMLANAQTIIYTGAWWTITFPGIAILVTVLAFHTIGDGLNDALNPRLR